MFKIITIMMIFVSAVMAQPGFDINYSSNYTSNTFYNYKSLPDFFHTLNAYGNYDWLGDGKGLRLSYDMDASFFTQYTDRNTHMHSLSTSYYTYLNSKHRFNGSLEFSKRANTDAYKYYEHTQVTFFNHLKYVFSSNLYGYIGGNIFVRNYNELDVFSYLQSDMYLRLSKFLNSGTSLILQFDYLAKSYLQSNPASPIETLPDLVTVGDGSSHQLLSTVRVAQSVSNSIGLSGQLSYRKTLDSSTRYLGAPDNYYYSDDEIFNDKFSYEAMEMNFTLKKRFKKWQTSAGYALSNRNYTERLAMDLEGYALPGNPLRQDTRHTFWGSLGYQLNLAVQPTVLSLDIISIHNNSNDPYYHFSNRYISMGIKQKF